jgi:Ser/Thr protein kinase RdoA (MazF antagonist)
LYNNSALIFQGFIHGDPNEQNILVRKSGSDDNTYVIAGILDFQDAGNTHPLYDLAMLIGYASLQATTFDPLEVGGHALAGYCSVVRIFFFFL